MTNTDCIYVFKTNIRTLADKQFIRRVLDEHRHIDRWTVDMDDVDCVLRVISSALCPGEIIELITHNGYQCQELE